MPHRFRYSTSTAGNHVLTRDGAEMLCTFPDDSPVFKADGSFDPVALNDLAGFLRDVAFAVTGDNQPLLTELCDNRQEV